MALALALGAVSCVASREGVKPVEHYGYYVFLGIGDFPAPAKLDPSWTSAWDLAEWKRRIDRLAELGTNTLFVYLMGHRLPYPSKAFPDCVETDHPNVKGDFFQEVLNHCKGKGIEVTAVFTTTGHAGAYVALHPEWCVVDRAGKADLQNAGPQQRILCHHREEGRRYPAEAIRECLARYRGFRGVIMHPPELLNPCFCPACQAAYRKEGKGDLLASSDEEARGFFMRSYLRFQKEELEPVIRELAPDARQLTFTIPHIFERHFEEVAKEIDPRTAIVDWEYDLSGKLVAALPARLARHRSQGHEVWFMPTSGYMFPPGDCSKEAAATLALIRAARESGVRDIVYFMGPIWWPRVEATSDFLRRQRE